jgi:hypothetical protein
MRQDTLAPADVDDVIAELAQFAGIELGNVSGALAPGNLAPCRYSMMEGDALPPRSTGPRVHHRERGARWVHSRNPAFLRPSATGVELTWVVRRVASARS